MRVPLQITWRNIDRSDALEDQIQSRAEKLEQICDEIISCRVVVDAPHQHHQQGNLFGIRLDIKVPGREIAVNRDPPERHAHEDIYVVMRDAFDGAKRQLRDYVRTRRGQVKRHEAHHPARVLRRFLAQDYGFLETPDGREIYFHRHALVDADFDQLDEGTPVSYIEGQGKEGPQANQVRVGKHHGDAL